MNIYNENLIINTLLTSYNNNNNIQFIYDELLQIVYNIIINLDYSFEPYLDIITDNGGLHSIIELFNTKYRNTDILKIDIYNRLQFYELLAFIALFDRIYTKITDIIYNNFCTKMLNLKIII